MFRFLQSLLPESRLKNAQLRHRPARRPALERLEDRLLLSVTGHIDSAGAGGISGWALSTSDISATVQIRIDVNGIAGTMQPASTYRADIAAAFGNGNHAFSIAGDYSNKVVDIWAWDPGTNAQSLLFTNSHAPTGHLDILSTTAISGWAFDQDTGMSATQVQVYLDGVAQLPVYADTYRVDLSAALGSPDHAFSINPGSLAIGTHSIQVFALDPDSTSAAPVLIGQGTVTQAGPAGNVDIFNGTTLSGWVRSGANPSAAVQYRVDVNGVAGVMQTANLYRADLAAAFGNGNCAFTVTGSFAGDTVNVWVWDPSTSTQSLLFTNSQPLTSHVDYVNSSGISGWVFSPVNTALPVQYRIDINGAVGTVQTANTYRADLQTAFGNGNHAFTLAGNFTTQVVDIWAWDPNTNVQSLIYTNSRPPTAAVDVISAGTVSGWVYDQDMGTGAALVMIDVDGQAGSYVSANQYRADLTGVLGSPNHGFTLSTGTLTSGTHTVQVYAMDPGSTDAAPVLVAQATVTKSGPMGYVDALNTASISGWAYSPDSGPDSVFVDLYINGTLGSTVTANAERDDVGAVIGSIFHGFYFATPTLNPGANLVQVYARDAAGNRTLLSQQTLTNQPPIGYVDQATSSTISGWMLDPDTPATSITYRLDINAVAGTPQTASLGRPDLTPLYGSANHGFSISGNFVGDVVDLYGYDTTANAPVLIYSSSQKPVGVVDSTTSSLVSGWVYDPDNPAAASEIRIDVDGVAGTPVFASQARPDIVGVTGGYANHGFSIPVTLTPGSHTINVYAIDADSSSQPPLLLASTTVTRNPPTGYVDSVADSGLSGWAYDPYAGSAPINVTLSVNGVAFATVSANLPRPDLATAIGSPDHGFFFDTSSLPAGVSRQLTITMQPSNGAPNSQVTLMDRVANNQPPVGFMDAVTGTTVSGWAYDPDAGANPISVDFYVDGTFAGTTIANLPRSDLASLGSTNHGFSINLPPLGFGPHKLEMFAVESFGTVSVKVAQTTVSNYRPLGGLLSLDSTQIAGWAYDPDISTAAMNVQLVVSNIVIGTYVAYQSNAGVDILFNSPNHAFTIPMPTLSTGTYEVDVYAIDPNNGLRTAIVATTLTV